MNIKIQYLLNILTHENVLKLNNHKNVYIV